jgi:molecular chaperone DnaK
MKPKGKPPFGIDLGTTMSEAAILDGNGEPKVIANREGELVTPSAVLFTKDQVIVGMEALHSAALSPEYLSRRFKRQMGNPDPIFVGGDGVSRTAADLSACVLRKLKEDSEMRLGVKISDAVITVPAYFDDAPRRATVEAGKMAGLNVTGILNEPTAAGIAYALDKQDDQVVMVYDLGGGTFDVTILSVQSGKIETLSTDGNANLGGSDFDDEMAKLILEEFEKQHGMKPKPEEHPAFFLDLMERAEQAKRTLSVAQKAVVSVGFDGRQVVVETMREQLENIIEPYIEETIDKCKKAIEAANLNWKDLSTIILVGGSTRIPAVAEQLERITGIKPRKDVEPDLVVAKGAAIDAAIRLAEKGERIVVSGKELPAPAIKKKDVIAHPLGCLAVDSLNHIEKNKVIIPANTPLPAERMERFALLEDKQTAASIVVAQGVDGALPQDCHIVGEVRLEGLPVRLPREERIRVTYRYDVDGIVHVKAEDEISGKVAEINIDYKEGLTNKTQAK